MMVYRPLSCTTICVVYHPSPCAVVACCDVSRLSCVATCYGSSPSPCAIVPCYGASPLPCAIVACCGLSLLALRCYFIVSHLFQIFNSPSHLTLSCVVVTCCGLLFFALRYYYLLVEVMYFPPTMCKF
jgi:hypothetical protein